MTHQSPPTLLIVHHEIRNEFHRELELAPTDRTVCQNRIFDLEPPYDDPWWWHTCLVPTTTNSPHHPSNLRYARNAISMVQSKTISLTTDEVYRWDYAIIDGFETTQDGALVSAINKTRTVQVTSNDNIHQYTYGQIADNSSGDLLKEAIFDKAGGAALLTRTYEYEHKTLPGYACLFSGCLTSTRTDTKVNWDRIHSKSLLKKTIITLGSDSYTTENISFNAYDAVTKIKESHSFDSDVRHTKYGYKHDTANWVLNLPTTTTISADDETFTEVNATTYQQITATDNRFTKQWLPAKTSQFGRWVSEYKSFHNDGNVKRIEFNADGERYQEFSSYKHGTAQTTTLPQRDDDTGTMTLSRTVNKRGLLSSETDLNGNTTSYSYDDLDRVQSINLPGDFQDLLFSWSTNASTQPIRITQSCQLNTAKTACDETGATLSKTETFDNLLRLIQVQSTDIANSTSRYQQFAYDSNSQLTFSAYHSDKTGETKGIIQTYDALQRPHITTISGGGSETVTYGAGNTRTVKNANGNSTTTTYQAFGSPAYDQATKIVSPESVITTLAVNVLGIVDSVTQSGPNKAGDGTVSQIQYHLYDANKQLCLVKRKDVGNTAYSRNALGEVLWLAQGVADSETCLSEPSKESSNKVSFSYDNLGDLSKTDYSDSIINNTPDVTYTRDNQGNLTTLSAGVTTQTYSYNSLNAITSETLALDGKSLNVKYGYNKQGDLSDTTYPDGDVITYAPNAFGEPTQAVWTGQSYATDATYHPNGLLKSFTFGNGIVHKMTLNDRQLPSNITDASTTVTAMNLSYDYDNQLNISSIVDGTNATFSLTTLSYDGLDRLTSTVGGTGIGSSTLTYDGLGNITNNGTRTFSFNRANQLTDSGNNSSNNSYVYDGHNRRVKTIDSKGTSYSFYTLSGQMLYREVNGNGINYIHLGKKLIAKYGIMPVSSTDSRQHYRPFGETIEAPKDDVGFTGHKFDTDLGLSYMQQRYMDPVLGRFMNNDPIGFRDVHSFNRYVYANNNPYKYTDPDGRIGKLINAGVN